MPHSGRCSRKTLRLPAVQLSLGLDVRKEGQHREAVEDFRAVLKKNPLSALAHFNLAVSYFEVRFLDEVVQELEATLLIAPYYTRVEALLGMIALGRKDFAAARTVFERILTFSPDDYAAHSDLRTLAVLEEKGDESQRHLRAAIAIDPRSAEADNTLGELLPPPRRSRTRPRRVPERHKPSTKICMGAL